MGTTTSIVVGGTLVLVGAAYLKTSRGAYETAPYTVLEKDAKFEIRDYEKMVWIETRGYSTKDKEGNNSFRKLFKYITGRNE